jgi:hypothetical protein
MDKKTVKLLNKSGRGQVRTYRTAFADALIKRGMAEEIEVQEVEKPKAKTNKKSK